MKSGKHQRSKQRCHIYVGRSMTMYNVLFCLHTLHDLHNQNISIARWLVPRSVVN